MHMNEGWADGHRFGIEYWEIWNEPDLDDDDSDDKRTWGGTEAQFFDFYTVAAKYLKSRFPNLKIGGPALVGITLHEAWARRFFAHLRKNDVPIDFFSWHRYTRDVEKIREDIRRARAILDEFGYTDTESHLNEWNYMRSGADGAKYAFKYAIPTLKGAAFTAAAMSIGQSERMDMMMYYDARPCAYNGLWAPYTYDLLPTYHVIKAWGEMLCMGSECASDSDIPNIYVTAAKSDDGRRMAMITYYSDDDTALPQTLTVELGDDTPVTLYRLDAAHAMNAVETVYPDSKKMSLTMYPNTVVVLK